MDERELNKFGKFLFERYYDEELTIPIKINNRLKRVHAWFIPRKDNLCIEISKHLSQQSIYVIADVLLHELTHYYLFKHERPYHDEDLDFHLLTYEKGINRTQVARVCEDGVMRYQCWKHEYKCECGFKIIGSLPQMNTDVKPILTCPQCNKKLLCNALGVVYEDYMPPLRLQMACEVYLENKNAV